MKILAIEFSTNYRSVAVGVGNDVIGYAEESGDSISNPFKLIESALQNAKRSLNEIECISVGLGPGSYTGIRIAISIAQGWQLARGVKLLGVSTIESMAEKLAQNKMDGKYRILIDAQRGEYYCADYDIKNGEYKCVKKIQIVSKEEALKGIADENRLIAAADVSPWKNKSVAVIPDAKSIIRLSVKSKEFVSGEKLEPIYLRPIAFVKAPPPRILDIS